MEPIDNFSFLRDQWPLIAFAIIALGGLYALIQYRGHQRRSISRAANAEFDPSRQFALESLATRLGLSFELENLFALGHDFPNMKLFESQTDLVHKMEETADKILGSLFQETTPNIRFRNVVHGHIDKVTVSILDHHYMQRNPTVFQTVVVLRCHELNSPHIVVRPKTKFDRVTGPAAAATVSVTDDAAVLDHYAVQLLAGNDAAVHQPPMEWPTEFINELARTPQLWLESAGDSIAICRHGQPAQPDEILALLDFGMKFKQALSTTSPSFRSLTYTV